jgi:hypothetical protein
MYKSITNARFSLNPVNLAPFQFQPATNDVNAHLPFKTLNLAINSDNPQSNLRMMRLTGTTMVSLSLVRLAHTVLLNP